jgi:hypothetical protein
MIHVGGGENKHLFTKQTGWWVLAGWQTPPIELDKHIYFRFALNILSK